MFIVCALYYQISSDLVSSPSFQCNLLLIFVLPLIILNFFFCTYLAMSEPIWLSIYIEEQREEARHLLMPRVEPQLLTYEGRSYAATFKHRQFYSKFVGSAWFEFSDDYGLRAGDRIVFTLDHLTFDLKIETYRGGQRLLPVPTVGKCFHS